MSLQALTDEELLRLAGRQPAAAPALPLSALSDEALLQLAARGRQAPAQAAPAPPEPQGASLLGNVGSIARAINPAAGLVDLVSGQRQTGAGAALGQGASMGWADELQAARDAAAGAVGLPGGMPYDQSMQQQRAEREAYSHENPITAGAAEIAGGVAGAGKIGAAARGAQGLIRSLPRLVGLGAASGAVAGAGAADQGKRTERAMTGGAVGALGGAVVPAAAAGVGVIGRALRNAAGLNANAADDAVLAAFGRDKLTPADVQSRLADSPAGVQRTIAGAAGTNTQGAAAGSALRPGAGQTDAVELATSRMDAMPERVRDRLRDATGPRQYAADLASEIKQQRWATAEPLYQEAFAKGTRIGGERVKSILQDEDVSRAYREAQKIAARDNIALAPVDAPDLRTLDYVKRALDGEIDSAFMGGKNTANAASLKRLRNELVDIMDTQGPPEYKQARASYGGDSEVLKAAVAGERAMTMAESELKIALRSFKSEAEKDAFRKAGLDAFMNKVASTGDGTVLNGLVNTPQKREVLKTLVNDPDRYALLSRQLLAEQAEAKALRRIAPTTGSATALRGADEANIAGGAQAVANAATGNTMGLIQQAMSWLSSRANGLTEQQRASLVADLLSNDPVRQRAVLERLGRRQTAAGREGQARAGRVAGAAVAGGALPGLLGGE